MFWIVLIIICGTLFTLSLALFPEWNARFTKEVVRLIEALAVILPWGSGAVVVYFVLYLLGAFE
jgi:hypothetical protein